VAGCVVAIPTLFMSLSEVTDLTSIGTLFAFMLVSGGLLKLEADGKKLNSKFKITYINAKYIFPALVVGSFFLLDFYSPATLGNFFSLSDAQHPDAGLWFILGEKLPFAVFSLGMLYLSVASYRKNLSLIPLLSLASCGYLATELGITNWLRFGLWLALGMVIYFLYGVRHSKLRTEA
jgi:hypothetical protein